VRKMLIDDYNPLDGKMLQILRTDGTVVTELEPKLDDSVLIQAYKTMVLTRVADEKAVKLQRQGRLGAYPPCKGQEAAQIGPAMAMRKDDWFVWSFRELAGLLQHQVPLTSLFLYWTGNEMGSHYPDDVRALPPSVPVGSQLSHAVGISYAGKYRGEDTVSVAFFGDGGSSEGDFHEAANFAGVYQLPVVFICQNNQYAISYPRKDQTRSRTLAQKAVSYGFPGIQVDGNDILAMYAAAQEAVDRARSGQGPTLIEAYTYRLGDHTTSDDATRYRVEAELDEWLQKDPLDRFNRYLEGKGLWNDDLEKAAVAEAQELVEKAVSEAENYPRPSVEDVFRYTYAEMSPDLIEQMEKVKNEPPRKVV
jgi:pyruvate dehydrogenase E1 component alpha subunit